MFFCNTLVSSTPGIYILVLRAPSLGYLFKSILTRPKFFCFSLLPKSQDQERMFLSFSALGMNTVALRAPSLNYLFKFRMEEFYVLMFLSATKTVTVEVDVCLFLCCWHIYHRAASAFFLSHSLPSSMSQLRLSNK